VEAGLGDTASRFLMRRRHADSFVAVTFPKEPGATGDDYHRVDDYGPREDITVRVTLLFHCVIPMASRYMCDKGYEILTGLPIDDIAGAFTRLRDPEIFDAAMSGDFARVRELSGYDDIREANDRLADSDQWMRELQHVDVTELQTGAMLTQQRFMVLRAEATLPNQGAPYYPREASDGE
jgi:hypothetical protein